MGTRSRATSIAAVIWLPALLLGACGTEQGAATGAAAAPAVPAAATLTEVDAGEASAKAATAAATATPTPVASRDPFAASDASAQAAPRTVAPAAATATVAPPTRSAVPGPASPRATAPTPTRSQPPVTVTTPSHDITGQITVPQDLLVSPYDYCAGRADWAAFAVNTPVDVRATDGSRVAHGQVTDCRWKPGGSSFGLGNDYQKYIPVLAYEVPAVPVTGVVLVAVGGRSVELDTARLKALHYQVDLYGCDTGNGGLCLEADRP